MKNDNSNIWAKITPNVNLTSINNDAAILTKMVMMLFAIKFHTIKFYYRKLLYYKDLNQHFSGLLHLC